VAPWLVIGAPGNPPIRIDLRLVDRVERHESSLLVARGELEVALLISDGADAVDRIVAGAASWTRGTTSPLPAASMHGALVIVSSTPDAEISIADDLAGRLFELTEPSMHLGRRDDNGIVIVHRSISNVHARVTRDPSSGRYTITDLQSTNGVRVNGEFITTIALRDGDIVDLGHVRTQFSAPEAAWVAAPQPEHIVLVGDDAVIFRDDQVHLGADTRSAHEVVNLARDGENLELGAAHLQAALVALAIP
jgi:hypothetical protein